MANENRGGARGSVPDLGPDFSRLVLETEFSKNCVLADVLRGSTTNGFARSPRTSSAGCFGGWHSRRVYGTRAVATRSIESVAMALRGNDGLLRIRACRHRVS